MLTHKKQDERKSVYEHEPQQQYKKINWFLLGSIFLILYVLMIVFMPKISDYFNKEEKPQKHSEDYIPSEISMKALENTENAVKSKMHNPDSYKYVKDQVLKKEELNQIWVLLTYRGTNAFGGVVTEQVFSRCNLSSGALVSLEFVPPEMQKR